MSKLKIACGVLLLSSCAVFSSAQNDVSSLIKAGDASFSAQKYDEAWKSYESANKAGGDKSSLCLSKMALTKLYQRDEGAALKLSDKAVGAAVNDKQRADAFATKGEILLALSETNPKRLAGAEEAFRSAQKTDPDSDIYQVRLGNVLLREGKMDEGKVLLEGFLKRNPTGDGASIVRQWLSHPTKVQYHMAPEFEVQTTSGEAITSKSLAGHVVVIDFWATWCPPCRASVPELKELTQKYSRDRLVVISVSSDSDQEKWKTFISEKQMTWPQYIDSDHHMTKIFNVHAFPTYIIIDGDGFVRERVMSFNPQESLAHRLKEPLKKMLE